MGRSVYRTAGRQDIEKRKDMMSREQVVDSRKPIVRKERTANSETVVRR